MKPASLDVLEAVGRRKVCAVAAEEDTPAALALFDVAARGRKEWPYQEWRAVLKELDACKDKVSDWLALRS